MRQIHYPSAALLLFVSFLSASTGHAAIIYVDRDNSCPGSGTSANPYCSLQNAFDVVAAGDTIRIRHAATPYDQRAILTTGGTASAPITIEPDAAHKPRITYTGNSVFAGAIEINNASYITINNLTFDGTGIQTSKFAILVQATTTKVVRITISGNTFNNWGGTGSNTNNASAIRFSGTKTSGFSVTGRIIGNTFIKNAHQAIRIAYGLNVLVENNDIRSMRCGLYSDARRGVAAIKDSQDGSGTVIRGNIIANVSNTDCSGITGSPDLFVGAYCDTGPTNGLIEKNTIHDVDYPSTNTPGDSAGVFIESRCHSWTVRENIIYNIGKKGMRIGSWSTSDPKNPVITSNTVANIGQTAIVVFRGPNLSIKNNILTTRSGGIVPIELSSEAVTQGPHTIDYNFFWDTNDGTKIGRWGTTKIRDLVNWRQQCNCDTKARSSNPLFMSLVLGSEDFRLSPSSPARGAGEGGVDAGANQSAIGPTAPNKLTVAP